MRIACFLSGLARKQVLVALILAGLSIGGRVIALRWVPVPKPAIQDEFSYLLAGDTFASGRLTNPKHPLWVHFETVHEIVQPTYQSKYPPGQGLLLGLGEAVFHEPWVGVLLSMGALTAAIYWALAGWLPPKWALLGGVLALLHVGFLNYWSESYWGGAAAGAAGALVIGAVPRLRKKPTARDAVFHAIGLVLLANTRPYEGAVLGVLCLTAILVKVPARFLIQPMAAVLIPAMLWMAYFNYRVTGHPLRMTYMEHERQYTISSPFIWQSGNRPEPHYNHAIIRASYVGWDAWQRADARKHWLIAKYTDWTVAAQVLLGAPLTICMGAFLVRLWRRQPKIRMAILLTLLFFIGLNLEVILTPHYVAPGTALAYVLAIAAVRRLRHFSVTLQWGLIAIFVGHSVWTYATPLSRALFDKSAFIAERDDVLKGLAHQPGKLLVLVDYGPRHDVNQEWVYNRADIDRSRIVWARGMGARDQELIDYYPDRQVWKFFDNGEAGMELSPLHGSESAHR
jgi:hypothetical protein